MDQPVVLATLTTADIDAATQAAGLQALTGKAKCDVKVVAINYNTTGAKAGDATTNASGVLLLPAGACATAAAPLVSYSRGTAVEKGRTLANVNDSETQLLVGMYASQGYAVVATDYLGYAKSNYPFHPYLHSDSEATSVLDAVRAGRIAAAAQASVLSGKVMFTGYSQGGHASMAAQRAAEASFASEFNVAASAHLAGPYYLSNSFNQDPIAGYQVFVPFMVNGYQQLYGDVFQKTSDVYAMAYTTTDYTTKFGSIANLLPSATYSYATLLSSGAVPSGTPQQARDALFQQDFLVNVVMHPTTNTLVLDAKKNDLLGWNPKAATLLCGGAADPTVSPAVHMNPAKADFDKRVNTVTTVDVDPQIKAAFGSVDAATYTANYHGTYEPPFCHVQARALFDTKK